MAEIYGFAINVEGNAVKSITAIDQKLSELGKNAQKTDSVFAGLFKMEALKQGLGFLKSIASETYNFGKQMEQTMLSFEVMTGSKDKAHALQAELKHLADISPMVDASIYDAGKMLLNYGVKAEDVGKHLKVLGDISGGNTDRFQRLTYVFGQISAQGRLTGQDLRQMIDAGFNPLQIMAEKSGKSYTYWRDQLEKGKVSYDQVLASMNAATGAGGRFYNMMERQAATVGGMESTLQGTVQSGMFGVFKQVTPMLKDILQASTDVAQSFADWVTPKQSEVMGHQRAEMSAMFEVLKSGNLPLDQRRELIGKLNQEYKDYIPGIITEKTTVAELAQFQNVANKQLLDKIKITAQQEILEKYFKEAAGAQRTAMEKQILYEKAKAGGLTGYEAFKLSGGIFTAQTKDVSGKEFAVAGLAKVQMDEAVKKANEVQKQLEKEMSYMPDIKGLTKDLNTKGLNETKNEAMKTLTSAMPATQNQAISAFDKSASTTSELAAGGGLGQAKTINMNFNQPLMQINAGSIDGQDMQGDAEKVLEQLTRELHNIAYEQGIM